LSVQRSFLHAQTRLLLTRLTTRVPEDSCPNWSTSRKSVSHAILSPCFGAGSQPADRRHTFRSMFRVHPCRLPSRVVLLVPLRRGASIRSSPSAADAGEGAPSRKRAGVAAVGPTAVSAQTWRGAEAVAAGTRGHKVRRECVHNTGWYPGYQVCLSRCSWIEMGKLA